MPFNPPGFHPIAPGPFENRSPHSPQLRRATVDAEGLGRAVICAWTTGIDDTRAAVICRESTNGWMKIFLITLVVITGSTAHALFGESPFKRKHFKAVGFHPSRSGRESSATDRGSHECHDGSSEHKGEGCFLPTSDDCQSDQFMKLRAGASHQMETPHSAVTKSQSRSTSSAVHRDSQQHWKD